MSERVTHEQARTSLDNLRMNLGGETIGTERLSRYIKQQADKDTLEPPGAPPPCGSMSADLCIHGNMARRCRRNR